jgi:hypothetical protein
VTDAAARVAAYLAEKHRREALRAAEEERAKAEAEAEERAEAAVQAELAERYRDIATRIRATLYDKQVAAFVEEKAHRVAMLCTRRAGKTFGGIREFVAFALENPKSRQLYINETRDECKALAWDEPDDGIIAVLDAFGLERGDKRGDDADYWANETELIVRFRNGAMIKLYGADDERQIDKLRGRKWHRVLCDEAQKARHLQALVQRILGASMADFEGQIWLTGTPSRDTAGYFYEVTRQDGQTRAPGWAVHGWSVTDNPFFGATPEARWSRTAAKALEENGWTEDEPDFQREWMGLWVITDANHVYPVHAVPAHILTFAPLRMNAAGKYDHEASMRDLPRGRRNRPMHWLFSIGLDFGFFPDPFAICMGAFSMETDVAYEMWSWKKIRTDADEQRDELKHLVDNVDNIVSIVGDPAGQRALMKGWRERFFIPIEDAEKNEKDTWIDLMGTAIRKGRWRYRENSPLLHEHRHLVWLPVKNGKRKEHSDRKLLDGSVPGNHCFVAGTMIETENGPRPIESLSPGVRVWTREGLRPILMTGQTGVEPVTRLVTESGRALVGTAGHRIWTEDGWKELGSLTPVSMLTAWRSAVTRTDRPRRLCSVASSTVDTQRPSGATSACITSRAGASICTEPSGSPLTARFRRAITSITSTVTRSITSCTTWMRSLADSISASTTLSGWLTQHFAPALSPPWPKQERLPPSGTGPRSDAPGTVSTRSAHSPGGRCCPRCASSAISHSRASAWPRCAACGATRSDGETAASTTSSSSAPGVAESSCGTDTRSPSTAPDRAIRVTPTGYAAAVYNLAVDGIHEYFANGILVANCSDAGLYQWRHMTNWLARPDVGPQSPEDRLAAEGVAAEKQLDQHYSAPKRDDGWEDVDEMGGWQ